MSDDFDIRLDRLLIHFLDARFVFTEREQAESAPRLNHGFGMIAVRSDENDDDHDQQCNAQQAEAGHREDVS